MTLLWKGELYGRRVEGSVQGGACHGSFEGPVSGPAELTDPRLARAALRAVLDDGTATFEGDEAPVEPVPEGVES
jgi:hypothetical protein